VTLVRTVGGGGLKVYSGLDDYLALKCFPIVHIICYVCRDGAATEAMRLLDLSLI
jgi:hypothetical protein